MQQEVSCSEQSLEVGEPLRGTAVADTELWVVLEHDEAWGPKGVEDSGLPAEVLSQLNEFTRAERRARVQLIRRPQRGAGGFHLYLANANPKTPTLLRRTLHDLGELSKVDLLAWAQGAAPIGFVQQREPLYLVCVHGRRDRCCALKGMPVFNALAELAADNVWQTTHLGGHRFAATLLVLPVGVCYGRVQASEAAELTSAHERNELYTLTRLRGRCAYPSSAQAAESLLREQLGEMRLDALSFVRLDAAADGDRVHFRHAPSEQEHHVLVTRETLGAFPQSCGAAAKSVDRFVTLRLSGH